MADAAKPPSDSWADETMDKLDALDSILLVACLNTEPPATARHMATGYALGRCGAVVANALARIPDPDGEDGVAFADRRALRDLGNRLLALTSEWEKRG